MQPPDDAEGGGSVGKFTQSDPMRAVGLVEGGAFSSALVLSCTGVDFIGDLHAMLWEKRYHSDFR